MESCWLGDRQILLYNYYDYACYFIHIHVPTSKELTIKLLDTILIRQKQSDPKLFIFMSVYDFEKKIFNHALFKYIL